MTAEAIASPLEHYRSVLKDAHARHTSAFFDNLVARAGIIKTQNTVLIRDIRKREAQLAQATDRNRFWKVLRIGLFILTGVFFLCASKGNLVWMAAAFGVLGFVMFVMNPFIKRGSDASSRIKTEIDELTAQAWQQMEPLNRLYDWSDFPTLARQTLPLIELDPYVAQGRFDSLRQAEGWTDTYNDGRMVTCAYSGVIKGNPFILNQNLGHRMGEKTYEGSKTITWTEEGRDAKGERITISRFDTLRAYITKPCPEYFDQTLLIYSNPAAPELTFDRQPSELSGLDDGLISHWRKAHAIKALEKKSRDLTDDSDYTLMANKEFDALFGAVTRSDEVAFRLLFTPLAQQEMLKLLKDKDTGYGDKFIFVKQQMLNLIMPSWLEGKPINAAPSLFRHYDLEQARTFFNAYHNGLFKAVYFSFAPLLAIPLYQQLRPHDDIYRRDADKTVGASCFWEHEAIAYDLRERLIHPDSVTRDILKTTADTYSDGTQIIHVTAYGYGGTQHMDYESVYGGDGRYHDVAVHWTEYYPVSRTTRLLIHDGRNLPAQDHAALWRPIFQSRGIREDQVMLRRGIAVALLDG